MLRLILAESSIERVPRRLIGHPSVVVHARRRGKHPASLILDRSYHHAAIRALETQDRSQSFAKRARPDIVFHVLLQALGSPLNREGLLSTYVHTVENKVIEVEPHLRLPRNYDRFIGILEQLYERGSVPPGEKPLLQLRDCTLTGLLEYCRPSKTIAFSTTGKPTLMKDASALIAETSEPAVLIGGFAQSHFEQTTLDLADCLFSVDRETLDAWVVAARLIYEYECRINLPERRLRG